MQNLTTKKQKEYNIERECLEQIEYISQFAHHDSLNHDIESFLTKLQDDGQNIPSHFEEYFNAFKYYSSGNLKLFIKNIVPIYLDAQKSERFALKHYCEFYLGSALFRNGQYSQALNYFSKCLQCDKLGLKILLSRTYNQIGLIHVNMSNFDKALDAFTRCFELIKDNQDTLSCSPALSNYIKILSETGNFKDALKYINQLADLIEKRELQNTYTQYYYLASYSCYLSNIGKHKEAYEWYEKNTEFSLTLSDKYQHCRALLDLCLSAKKGGYTKKIEEYLNQYSEALNEHCNIVFLDKFAAIYTYLAESETDSNHKKLDFYQKATQLYAKAKLHSNQRESDLLTDLLEIQLKEARLEYAYSLEQNLDLINLIGNYLTTSYSTESFVFRLKEDLNQFMDSDVFGLGIYNKDTQQLHYDYFIENNKLVPSFVSDCQSNISLGAYVVNSRRFFVDNDFSEESLENILDLSNAQYHIVGEEYDLSASVIFAPIIFENEVLGAITVQSKWKYNYTDYHVKIVEQIVNYLGIGLMNIRRRDELLKQKSQLQRLSITDQLTSLYNRQGLMQHLAHHQEHFKHSVSILLIDIDYFKQYNDGYGHLKGDELLVALSSVFHTVASSNKGHAYRYGGDEFMIILSDTNLQKTQSLTQDLFKQLSQLNTEHSFSPINDAVTISIGGLVCNAEDLINFDTITHLADQHLYAIKESGRNQFRIKDLYATINGDKPK